MFRSFGHIAQREGGRRRHNDDLFVNRTGEYAYITMQRKEDAMRAMDEINRRKEKIGNCIVSVSLAKSRNP